MRNNNNDLTLERNYIQKFQFLMSDEERSHQSLNGMAPNKFNQNYPRIT